MQSPLVVEALREQLHRVMEWHANERPGFRWGCVIHRRNERGRFRFGCVSQGGESFLLTERLLQELSQHPCWLDGAVRVTLECRESVPEPELEDLQRPDRPPLVEAMAVYFDPGASGSDAAMFQAMAGVLTPTTCPTELFLLTRERPAGWPL
ncbi:MAG TPA: hypothetical protein VFK09_00375 [Gemmatimonadales bacterium]|jgi:hypothetical protein|nr:hypothetical protein [Gemmatimonadales bacterium]